jgi:hypothetical protein
VVDAPHVDHYSARGQHGVFGSQISNARKPVLIGERKTMADIQGRPAVFMPENEPYLGLESVLWFDRIIVWALEGNQRVASYTHAHKNELSPLQKAASQIIPQGINIALSIRELVRQGYLFPALVLMRPLIERAAVLSYLCANSAAVVLWESGWKHGQRPGLAKMLQSMSGTNIDLKTAQAVCDAHNPYRSR